MGTFITILVIIIVLVVISIRVPFIKSLVDKIFKKRPAILSNESLRLQLEKEKQKTTALNQKANYLTEQKRLLKQLDDERKKQDSVRANIDKIENDTGDNPPL